MKIAVLDDYTSDARNMADWARLGSDITFFTEAIPEHALQETLIGFDVICLMRERTAFPAALIEALPNLKLIVTTGPRNAAIDVAAAKARGIPVSGTTSRKTTTSELAMTMILALSRGLVPEAASLAAGGWQKRLGRDLNGLTLGLIGLGNIGSQMATIGRAFGMTPIAWSQNLTVEKAEASGVGFRPSLNALMADADAVSVHLVLSERSKGLIGRAAFQAMRPDGVFVNTSRGPIADTAALLDVMRARPDMKAGLDVFDTEPVPAENPILDRALIASGQLLLTPHLGYTTQATFEVFYRETVESVAAWIAGNPIRLIG